MVLVRVVAVAFALDQLADLDCIDHLVAIRRLAKPGKRSVSHHRDQEDQAKKGSGSF